MISVQNLIPIIIALGVVATTWYFLTAKKPILDPKVFKSFKLIEKIPVTYNTSKYRFQLPKPDDVLILPVGQHISIMAEINGKQISRSYTPTTLEERNGYFDLIIKVINRERKNSDYTTTIPANTPCLEQSYPTGNISKLMGELKIGDSIGMRGPKGNFSYKRNMVKYIGMIAGGTGITPMLQVIRRICNDPTDHTEVTLIFANVTQDDILLKKELDDMAAASPNNFKVHYVLEKPPQDWKEEVGFVTKEIIQKYCAGPTEDVKLLLCGPLPMIKVLTAATNELGYQKPRAVSKMEDQVYKF